MTIPKHLMEAKLCNKDTCAEVEQLNSLVNSCQEEIRTLKEENQRLKEQIRKYKDLGFEHLCKENQRLNNVINALEESYIEDIKKLESFGIERQVEIAEIISCYKFYLRRLRKLKESDK